jgi:hypothetical protein
MFYPMAETLLPEVRGADSLLGRRGRAEQERQGDCPAHRRPLQFLPECHSEAEGEVLIELTKSVKAIDPTLVSKLQTWGNVFDQPEIDTDAEVEPGLGGGALAVVEAVAPRQKRLDLLPALIALEVVGHIR